MKKALGLASLAGLALLAREVYRQRLVQQALLTWASAVDGLTGSEDPAEKAVLRSDLEGARRKLNGLEFRPYLSGKLGGPNVKESGPMGGGRDRPDRPDPGLAAEMRERARVAAEQAAREAAAAREVAARETAAREAATREAEAREFAIREEAMRAEKVRQDQAREASRDRDRQVEAAAERLTRAADKWNNAATPKEKGELVQEMLDARRKLDELMAKP